MVRGEGSYLFDEAGNPYLDPSAGLVAVNLGHGHPRVVEAIQRQAEQLCCATAALGIDAREAFAERLARLSP